jgi:predicted transcriptional regulator
MSPDPVEEYLDELADVSRLRGRRLRHALAEVEDHLATAREAHVRAGADDDEAGRRAVAEFGPAPVVAAGLDRAAAPQPVEVLRAAVGTLVAIGVVGLLAIGVSGLLGAAGAAAYGKAFVSGDPTDVRYSAARCADFQEYHRASTCEQAAVLHHYDEVVWLRIEVGALALVLAVGWLLVARPWRRRPPRARAAALPAAVGPTVGAAVFGLATLALLPTGVAELVSSGTSGGAGNALSAGLVSAAVAAGYALMLWRSLRAAPA